MPSAPDLRRSRGLARVSPDRRAVDAANLRRVVNYSALTVPAPIVMSYLLMFATGAKRTERRMQDRPGYHDYQRRVAFFLPRPPRR
jgi:protein-S-isoprenylcysteine O-methyltransferase Ste14